MDLSKLPKFSETPKPAEAPAEPSSAAPAVPVRVEVYGAGIEAWISIGVGLLLLFMYNRMPSWVCSRLFGTSFAEFTLDGQVVPYPQVPEFWMDMGPTLFAVALLVDGICVTLARKWSAILWPALVLTGLVTAYNLVYVFASFPRYGLAPLSALAVIFGVVVAMYQWRLLQALRGPAEARSSGR